MPQRILLFNHKGGVGKTTSAYNIGWKLNQKGHRVLLVDGDSQINLTARTFFELKALAEAERDAADIE